MVVSESIEMLDTQVYAENRKAMQQIQRMTASKEMTTGKVTLTGPGQTRAVASERAVIPSWYLACLMYWEWHAYASLEGKLIGHGQAGHRTGQRVVMNMRVAG